MIINVEVDTSGMKAHIDRIIKALRGECLEAIADGVRIAINDIFEMQGPGWKDITEETVEYEIEHERSRLKEMIIGRYPKKRIKELRSIQGFPWEPHMILIWTGALRASYIEKNDKYHYEKIDPNDCVIELGSKVEYAGFHQYGTDILPRRAIKLTNSDKLKDIPKMIINALRQVEGDNHESSTIL